MQKTLRFLGLVAVIGAFAIVVAQSGSARTSAGTGQGNGEAAANPANSGFSNNVLELMGQYFSFKQNVAIDRVKEAGHDDRIDPIIHANCTAMLWLQTADQQRGTIASWEIEKWATNKAKWHEIARSPTLVKSLLSVPKPIDAKVYGYIEEVWKPIMDQNREFDEQFVRSAAYKNAKTQHEKNVAHYEALKVWRQSHPLPPLEERQAGTIARYEKALKQTYKLLTPVQQKEMTLIQTRFEAALKTAINGDRP